MSKSLIDRFRNRVQNLLPAAEGDTTDRDLDSFRFDDDPSNMALLIAKQSFLDRKIAPEAAAAERAELEAASIALDSVLAESSAAVESRGDAVDATDAVDAAAAAGALPPPPSPETEAQIIWRIFDDLDDLLCWGPSSRQAFVAQASGTATDAMPLSTARDFLRLIISARLDLSELREQQVLLIKSLDTTLDPGERAAAWRSLCQFLEGAERVFPWPVLLALARGLDACQLHPVFTECSVRLQILAAGHKVVLSSEPKAWPLPIIARGDRLSMPASENWARVAWSECAGVIPALEKTIGSAHQDLLSGKLQAYDAQAIAAVQFCIMLLYGRPAAEISRKLQNDEAAKSAAELSFDVEIAPLWAKLCELGRHRGPTEGLDAYRHRIPKEREVRILNAMRIVLTREPRSANYVDLERKLPLVVDGAPLAGATVTVLPEPIVAGVDHMDRDVVEMFRALEKPLPVTALPDAQRIEQIDALLKAEFPWATDVVDEIVGELAARRAFGATEFGFATVLVVGMPGCGKTRLARRLAEEFKAAFMPIPLGGSDDGKVVLGTSRGWAGGRPSALLQFVLDRGVANGLVMLDEIDKVDTASRTTPALLGLLERESAARWRDVYLLVPCDLSHLSYYATSNSIELIPRPLLSRMRPLLMPEPQVEHVRTLGGAVANDIAKEWGLPPGIFEGIWQEAPVAKVRNIRELQAAMRRHLRRWAAGRAKVVPAQ